MNLRTIWRSLATLVVAVGLVFVSSPAMAAVSDGNPAVTSVGQSPRGLAYSPNGEHLYVANSGSGTVSDVDPATGQVVSTIAVSGINPVIVTFAPDGSLAYVASRNDGTVSIIDVATHTETGSIVGLQSPTDLAVSPDGLTLYVSQFTTDSVAIYDLSAQTPSLTGAISVGAGPTALTISRFGDRLYVASYSVSTFSTIDTTTNNVIATTQTATNPYDIEISPDGSWLAVSHETSHAVYVYDLSGTGFTSLPLVSQSYGVTFSPDSSHLFISEYVPNMVADVDLTNGNVFTAHSLVSAGSGPFSVAVSPNGCQIATTGSVSNVVSFLEASPCMGPPDIAENEFPITEKLASTGQDGVATLAWTAGAVLALLAGASILILLRNKSASEFRR